MIKRLIWVLNAIGCLFLSMSARLEGWRAKRKYVYEIPVRKSCWWKSSQKVFFSHDDLVGVLGSILTFPDRGMCSYTGPQVVSKRKTVNGYQIPDPAKRPVFVHGVRISKKSDICISS